MYRSSPRVPYYLLAALRLRGAREAAARHLQRAAKAPGGAARGLRPGARRPAAAGRGPAHHHAGAALELGQGRGDPHVPGR